MRFRRSSRKAREPLFWVRNVFTNTLNITNAQNTATIGDSVVQNVDQVAIGGVTFSGIDERYTARRVIVEKTSNCNAAAGSGDRAIIPWWCFVKTSSTALVQLINQPLRDILQGGGFVIPGAMDVLAYGMETWISVASSHGFVTSTQVNQPPYFDMTARRLESDECVAMLTGMVFALGETLAVGGSISVNTTYEVSALYSRTLRRR